MNPDVEAYVRGNVPWPKLPEPLKQQLGNSQKEYDKCVITFSVRNQVRYRGNLIRLVRKDEKKYYEELIDYSRRNLMLFPYHLSDVIINGVCITPFQYYVSVLDSLMAQEKSYDMLPNFTAADCLRLLGVGRNQYIDLMNLSRSSKKFGFFRKSGRELLPMQPIETVTILPWWTVQIGYITEDDMKNNADKADHCLVDQIIDNGPCPAGHLNYDTVLQLYLKGMIYFDVPISDDDVVNVPPLEGFVMNRVLGDFFETLLYKVFVSIDEHTTVKELASVLDVEVMHVRDAVSLYCRLGFAKKKNADLDSNDLHPSWYAHMDSDLEQSQRQHQQQHQGRNRHRPGGSRSGSRVSSSDEDDSLLRELNEELEMGGDTGSGSEAENDDFVKPDQVDDFVQESFIDGQMAKKQSTMHLQHNNLTNNISQNKKKIAFLFDSTLTAYLMMGNLSPGLKTHAVTMFEVGKLSDECMDSFINELEKVSNADGEGEAARYFSHALTLRETILFLRQNSSLNNGQGDATDACLSSGLDLIRCESLQSLDPSTASRLLNKNYSLLISMAPLANEIRPVVDGGFPPHLGPVIPEISSIWFKMFLYHITGSGPPSLLFPKGSRPRRLPKVFEGCSRLLVTTWGHDPSEIPFSGALTILLDALHHSAVLVQAYCETSKTEATILTLPFPLSSSNEDTIDENDLSARLGSSTFKKLDQFIDLHHSCGYITLLSLGKVIVDRGDEGGKIVVEEKCLLSQEVENGRLNREGEILLKEELDGVIQNNTDCSPSSSLPPDHDLQNAMKSGIDGLEKQHLHLDLPRPQMLNSSKAENWLLMDINFGIPLFDSDLNRQVCHRIISHNLCKSDSLLQLEKTNRDLCKNLLEFVVNHQDLPIGGCNSRFTHAGLKKFNASKADPALPTSELFFDGQKMHLSGKTAQVPC